jgi:uncharacterized membrane protein
MIRIVKYIGLFFIFFLLLSTSPHLANATETYAHRTGKGCIFCHQESTGGQLKTVGFAYIRNGYQYPISERILNKAKLLQSPLHKTLRFLIGYLHLLAGIVFFGAIFYIHLFIKPTQLTSGIPKAERLLGLSCMLILTLTGIYLTWVRIERWEQFFNNTLGLMLFIKIVLFAVMVIIGLTAMTFIHRKMKGESQARYYLSCRRPPVELGSSESKMGSRTTLSCPYLCSVPHVGCRWFGRHPRYNRTIGLGNPGASHCAA